MQTYYSLLRKDLLSENDYLRIAKRIANCGITI